MNKPIVRSWVAKLRGFGLKVILKNLKPKKLALIPDKVVREQVADFFQQNISVYHLKCVYSYQGQKYELNIPVPDDERNLWEDIFGSCLSSLEKLKRKLNN